MQGSQFLKLLGWLLYVPTSQRSHWVWGDWLVQCSLSFWPTGFCRWQHKAMLGILTWLFLYLTLTGSTQQATKAVCILVHPICALLPSDAFTLDESPLSLGPGSYSVESCIDWRIKCKTTDSLHYIYWTNCIALVHRYTIVWGLYLKLQPFRTLRVHCCKRPWASYVLIYSI